MKYPPFFSDLTNKVISIIFLIGILLITGSGIYLLKIKDAGYVKLDAVHMLDATKIESFDFSGPNYVSLYNFCMDDNSWYYKEKNEPAIYYFFINNACDSLNNAPIIVEMDDDIYDIFSETEDAKEIEEKVFEGRIFKGTSHLEAPYYMISKELKRKEVYTFRAGHTPRHVYYLNKRLFFIISGITVLTMGGFVIAMITHNRKRKKAFEKKLAETRQQENDHNNNPTTLFPS